MRLAIQAPIDSTGHLNFSLTMPNILIFKPILYVHKPDGGGLQGTKSIGPVSEFLALLQAVRPRRCSNSARRASRSSRRALHSATSFSFSMLRTHRSAIRPGIRLGTRPRSRRHEVKLAVIPRFDPDDDDDDDDDDDAAAAVVFVIGFSMRRPSWGGAEGVGRDGQGITMAMPSWGGAGGGALALARSSGEARGGARVLARSLCSCRPASAWGC